MNSVPPPQPVNSHAERWTVVIPVKAPAAAKSRLGPAVPPDARAALARAFALDTIAAALDARSVARVIVVGDDPSLAGGAEFLAEPVDGPRSLARAIAHGVAHATPPSGPGHTGVAVLLGDLPALTARELDATLDTAARHPRAFVADAEGTGTTLATARAGVRFHTEFGHDSAARHAAAGFARIEASDAPGLHRDVDTVDALLAALSLGVGQHTREVVERSSLRAAPGPP